MFQRHEVRRADDGLLIPNLVMEELPTIREESPGGSNQNGQYGHFYGWSVNR